MENQSDSVCNGIRIIHREVLTSLQEKNLVHAEPITSGSALHNSLKVLIEQHLAHLPDDKLLVIPAHLIPSIGPSGDFSSESDSSLSNDSPEHKKESQGDGASYKVFSAEDFARVEKCWKEFLGGKISLAECSEKMMAAAKDGPLSSPDSDEMFLNALSYEPAAEHRWSRTPEEISPVAVDSADASSLATDSPKFLKKLFYDYSSWKEFGLPVEIVHFWYDLIKSSSDSVNTSQLESFYKTLLSLEKLDFSLFEEYLMEEHSLELSDTNPETVARKSAEFFRAYFRKMGVPLGGDSGSRKQRTGNRLKGQVMKKLTEASSRIFDTSFSKSVLKLSDQFRNSQPIGFLDLRKTANILHRALKVEEDAGHFYDMTLIKWQQLNKDAEYLPEMICLAAILKCFQKPENPTVTRKEHTKQISGMPSIFTMGQQRSMTRLEFLEIMGERIIFGHSDRITSRLAQLTQESSQTSFQKSPFFTSSLPPKNSDSKTHRFDFSKASDEEIINHLNKVSVT